MSQITNIRSVSTMATWPVYNELVLFIRSLRAVHPNIPLLILTQHKVAQQLATDNLIDDHTTIIIGMEKFGLSSWQGKSSRYECHFLAHKSLAMKAALMKYPNTLFIDCDVLILAPLPKIDETKDIGLQDLLTSHHVCQLDPNPSLIHSQNRKRRKFRYTGGWIFVNHSKFPHRYWQVIHELQDERPTDQLALVTLTGSFSYFLFPINDHIYTFLLAGRYKHNLRLRQVKTQPVLSYRNKPIRAIHFHFLSQHDFNSAHAFWVYLLYKSHSPWFDYINNHPGYFHYDLAELRSYVFLFTSHIEHYSLHRAEPSTTSKQYKFMQSNIHHLLIKIYKYLILPYYLVPEILLFHRIIHKSEFAIPRWKLFIITFGWTYRLLGRRYRKKLSQPLTKLNTIN